MPVALTAALWGWLAGSSLLIGAFLGWYLNLSQRIISSVMAFGSGVLISALSFDLMEEALLKGGAGACIVGFLLGVLFYTVGAFMVNKHGAKYRKRSGLIQKKNKSNPKAIALGALLDGIPESIVIGLSLFSGKGVSLVAVIAIFISNIPEGLSSSHGMKNSGTKFSYVFGMWGAMAFSSGIASFLGYQMSESLSLSAIAGIMAFAAGAILSMIVTTMIPEACEEERELSGVVTAVGFLMSFILSKFTDLI